MIIVTLNPKTLSPISSACFMLSEDPSGGRSIFLFGSVQLVPE